MYLPCPGGALLRCTFVATHFTRPYHGVTTSERDGGLQPSIQLVFEGLIERPKGSNTSSRRLATAARPKRGWDVPSVPGHFSHHN